MGNSDQPASGPVTAPHIGAETTPVALCQGYVKDGRFEIRRLPPGRYRLMFIPIVADRPAGPPVYYPGIQARSAAALIEVGEGTHVEGLLFTIL